LCSLITCKALKFNIEHLMRQYNFNDDILYFDAGLHNFVNLLNERVTEALENNRICDKQSIIGFGRCCGNVEELSRKYDSPYTEVENCYHLFLGNDYYNLLKEIPGTFFLTNYLAENFEDLIIKPQKIDIHPKIKNMLFKHYERIIFIDTENSGLTQAGVDVADYLDLPIVYKKADLHFFKRIMFSLGIFKKNNLSINL
jgi:hypothetical protein